MNDNDCFAPDEPHKKEYVDAVLSKLEEPYKEVGIFNSAIELCSWDGNGYEFLYDFAIAALNVAMTTPTLTMQDIIDAGRGLDHTPSEIQP